MTNSLPVRNHLRQLEAAGLIHVAQVAPELAFRFRHALIEQAAHGSLVRADRRRLHRLVAEQLEALYADQLDELAPELALHFAAAGQHAQAVAYHRRAARHAQTRYANQEAVQHLQAALNLLPPDAPVEVQAGVREELADAYSLVGSPTLALPHYRQALALAESKPAAEPWMRVRLHRKIVEALTESAGSIPIEMLADALRDNAQILADCAGLAGSAPPHAETVRLLSALARMHVWIQQEVPGWAGDLASAERYAEQALRLAEQLEAPIALSSALEVLAGVLYARGRLRERVAVALRRLALAPQLEAPGLGPRGVRERLDGLIGAGAALAEVGEYAQAIPHLQAAEQQAAAVGAITAQIAALRLLIQCWFSLDRWERVLEAMARCRALAAQYAPEQTGPLCYEIGLIAGLHALRGEMDQARALREESYAIMTAVSGPTDTWARQQHY